MKPPNKPEKKNKKKTAKNIWLIQNYCYIKYNIKIAWSSSPLTLVWLENKKKGLPL